MILIELHGYDISIFIVTAEAGIILLLEFYDLNWVNFGHFICQIDPYSGLKIDLEFRVKYVDPGFRVNLTIDNQRNGLETQAKSLMRSVIRPDTLYFGTL